MLARTSKIWQGSYTPLLYKFKERQLRHFLYTRSFCGAAGTPTLSTSEQNNSCPAFQNADGRPDRHLMNCTSLLLCHTSFQAYRRKEICNSVWFSWAYWNHFSVCLEPQLRIQWFSWSCRVAIDWPFWWKIVVQTCMSTLGDCTCM